MAKKVDNPVIVKVKSDGVEIPKDLHVYLFDDQERLLESAELKKGEAKLKASAENIRGKSQIIIGPAIPKEFKGRKINPILIRKMGGYQPSIRIDAKNEIIISGLPKFKIPTWAWCLITGNLSKSFSIDGESKILPVCDARVHICEIDRIKWWWPKIPRPIITDLGLKLKEIILKPKIKFPPIPDPKIIVDPRIPIKKSINPITNSALDVPTIDDALALAELPDNVKKGLLSNSEIIVQQTIFDNFKLLHPYLCLWPWFWPYFYRCTKIATVYSDCNGSFDYNYLNFTNDKDIYIWVEANIDGEWTTVYRPNIPCNTHWDYTCGKDINIRITDPRVRPCSCDEEIAGEIVWFRSIGEKATALRIQQNLGSTATVQGTTLKNVGCTNNHDLNQINPFGSTLKFELLFGDGLPTAGITHYRWKKTQVKNANLDDVPSPETTVVSGPVQKHYFVITKDDDDHYHFQTKTITLGEEGTAQNIGYRIPAWNVEDDTGFPPAHAGLTVKWTEPYFWSASVDSTDLADGLWRFDLELLRLVGGVFEVVEVPKEVFQISDHPNSGNSIDAPNRYLSPVPGNTARRLNLLVRIDNNKCVAEIQDVALGAELSGPCGFLHYTSGSEAVKISFNASQINNFASFSFSTIKGNNTESISPSINESGYVISSIGRYTLAGGIFSDDDIPVSQLIGSCPQAAFSERLYVASLATDGTYRLRQYDASDNNAFALSST